MYTLVHTCISSQHTHTQLGETAVYYASGEGHSEVVKLLVQAEADLELQHKVWTCLYVHELYIFDIALLYM